MNERKKNKGSLNKGIQRKIRKAKETWINTESQKMVGDHNQCIIDKEQQVKAWKAYINDLHHEIRISSITKIITNVEGSET